MIYDLYSWFFFYSIFLFKFDFFFSYTVKSYPKFISKFKQNRSNSLKTTESNLKITKSNH